MSKRQNPDWRDRVASALLIDQLDGLDLDGNALVMDDPLQDVGAALQERGVSVTPYDRRALGNRAAASWPTPGPYGLATLRLPRAKEELSMGLSAAASVLSPGGSILVCGANDEGIQGAVGSVGEVFSSVETLAVGGRCRVVRGMGVNAGADGRPCLEEWRTLLDLDYPDLPPAWVSYPGVFSHGRLDAGTRRSRAVGAHSRDRPDGRRGRRGPGSDRRRRRSPACGSGSAGRSCVRRAGAPRTGPDRGRDWSGAPSGRIGVCRRRR